MQQPPGNGNYYNNNNRGALLSDVEVARQESLAAIDRLAKHVNALGGYVRGQLETKLQAGQQRIDQQLTDLAKVAGSIAIQHGGAGAGSYVRPEDIPGKRIPYTVCIDIPISNGMVSLQEQSYPIGMEGLFVAVRRMCTFQSFMQCQYTNPSTNAISRFATRTYGRYRPVSSLADTLDAMASIPLATVTQPLPNGLTPAAIQLPGTMSGFRSMEFDGRVLLIAAGSSVPRSNVALPTPGWSPGHGHWQDLGFVDIFERGELLQVQVTPSHVNNPPAGNVDGLNIFGAPAAWPFLAGQYDAHEGIVTPGGVSVSGGVVTRIAADPMVRLPDGIFTVLFDGYRIMNPGVGIV